MGYDIGPATVQATLLGEYASEARGVANRLSECKTNLNAAWSAQEMVQIDLAFDNIIKLITSLSTTLDSLASEIKTSATEKQAEEKAADEKAAKDKAAKDNAAAAK